MKFIRFAQWRIDRTGHGVLGFVTNHAYIDGPTFRGMRQQLALSFDSCRVLDLHGNAKKQRSLRMAEPIRTYLTSNKEWRSPCWLVPGRNHLRRPCCMPICLETGRANTMPPGH